MTPPNPTAPSGPYVVEECGEDMCFHVVTRLRIVASFDYEFQGDLLFDVETARRHAEAFAAKLNAEHAAFNESALADKPRERK